MLRWGALAACVVVVGAAVTLHYDGWQGERSVAEKSQAAPTAAVESNSSKQPGPELAAKIAPTPLVVPHRDLAGVAGGFSRKTEKKRLKSAAAPCRNALSFWSAAGASPGQPAGPAAA